MNIVHQSQSNVYTHIINRDNDYVSHELRISLTGILGANYLLEQTELSAPQKELLKLIYTSANRLLSLADKFQ
jgi:signal transduction histidine kinase